MHFAASLVATGYLQPHQQQRLEIKDAVSVGRTHDNNLVIDSKINPKNISRKHCTLFPLAGLKGIKVIDNGSTNGVFINGNRVNAHANAVHGDIVRFGNSQVPFGEKTVFEFEFRLEIVDKKRQASTVEDAAQVAKAAKTEANNKFEQVLESLSCVICLEPTVCAHALSCGHSFCADCIEEWIAWKKKECPTCRRVMEADPCKCVVIDNTIETTLSQAPDLLKAWLARREMRLKYEKDFDKLKTKQKMPNGFLTVKMEWKKSERKEFHKGLKQYKGNARLYFCDLVDYTVSTVEKADQAALMVMARNILELDQKTAETASIMEVKAALMAVLQGKQPSKIN